jgi:beta-galactosidase
MKKIDFNNGWRFRRNTEDAVLQPVTLPHDAMLGEPRANDSAGGANISWFQGGDYVYEKRFELSALAEAGTAPEKALLEFEGVYRNAQVYLNDQLVAEHPYGYTRFYADLTDHLRPGENALRVRVNNAQQPNSRWYSGSGIYRPVSLCLFPARHILLNSVKVRTLDYREPTISVSVGTSGAGAVSVEILPEDRDEILWQADGTSDGQAQLTLPLPGATLWSPGHPALYRCRVRFGDDCEEVRFGVRVVECDAASGFRINGQRLILRGACIHHDNGVLGARAEPFAEARKVRLLKAAGYNALRSAHNPCSTALLEACDREGMLMMDEYVDMWYIHKTKYDYADTFDAQWRQDLNDMIEKDYNHPSVVLYSIGNEVSETAQKRGIALTGDMRDHIHALDGTRPVTCGVNIFFNYLSSLGFGVYTDKKAEKTEIQPGKHHKAVGSEFFNNLAGITGAEFMKHGAMLHGSNVKTRDAFARLDIAGYNYGIYRYRHDLRQYPNRVILGCETFCADAYRFWEMAKQHPALIGDFVWAGMDYLGEAGIGAWEYKDYAPDFDHGAGWITAGSGRLDITGRSNGEALYTRVAFELSPIEMAVVPVSRERRAHSPSAWKMTNAIPSWSWQGMEGATATVEVYARTDQVALYLNGERVAQEKRGNRCRFVFRIPYQGGTLEAKGLGADARVLATTALKTADDKTILSLMPEQDTLGMRDLAYVRLRYTDAHGTIKPLTRGDIRVQVENGTLEGLGNGCSYNERSYLDDVTDTYYGEALAVIRPNGLGDVKVTATSPYGQAETTITYQNTEEAR